MFHHEFLATSDTFLTTNLVAPLVKVGSMKQLQVCHLDILFYHSTSYTGTIEEEALHSRLFLVEQVNRYQHAITHLPKVHLGNTVHHRVADPSPSPDEVHQPLLR